MRGLRNTSIVILLVILGVLIAATAATSSTRSSSGSWRLLPAAPVSFPQSQSGIWTGRRLILIGRTPLRNPSKDVAAAYNPTTNRWTKAHASEVAGLRARLPDRLDGQADADLRSLPLGRVHPGDEIGGSAPWSRRSTSASSPGRDERRSVGAAAAAATPRGTEAPTTRRPAAIASCPVTARREPARARCLDGARADPLSSAGTTSTASCGKRRWRPRRPTTRRRTAGTASRRCRRVVMRWAPASGRNELLVVGAGKTGRSAYAYNPATNRWRTLASLPAARSGIAVWAGTRLLLLGGENRAGKSLRDGLAYDPKKTAGRGSR